MSLYRIIIDGSVWDEGLTADEVTEAVRRAAASVGEDRISKRLDHEVGEAEVELDQPTGGLVGEWSCIARVGHQGYDIEEAWGGQVSAPGLGARRRRARRGAGRAHGRRREGGMSNSRCGSCGAPIRWCVTTKGKAMPVDYAPVRGGNIVLEDQGTSSRAVYVTPLLESEAEKGRPHYVSHFATCAFAAKHRRKAS